MVFISRKLALAALSAAPALAAPWRLDSDNFNARDIDHTVEPRSLADDLETRQPSLLAFFTGQEAPEKPETVKVVTGPHANAGHTNGILDQYHTKNELKTERKDSKVKRHFMDGVSESLVVRTRPTIPFLDLSQITKQSNPPRPKRAVPQDPPKRRNVKKVTFAPGTKEKRDFEVVQIAAWRE